MKILITGATGNLGNLVLEALLNKVPKENIAVMLRSEKNAATFSDQGIEVRIGNYDDIDSMIGAFKGIDKLYFVSGPDLEARLTQHVKVVEAATAAKVGHVVYTSFSRKDGAGVHPLSTLAQGHIIAENALKESRLLYTILLNNYYMEVIPLFVGENILKSQTIYFPAGQGKSGFISRQDIAELSAVILTTAGHEQQIYEVSGERAYDFDEVAEMISDASGTSIGYISPSEDEFRKALKEYGLAEEIIEISALSGRAIVQGEFEKTSKIYEEITGRKPTSLGRFLKQQYGSRNSDVAL